MVKKEERGGKKGGVVVVNRGAWTAEEDQKLVSYVRAHGDKKWRSLPVNAGLNRCGKSCRLRWLNYLRPGIKRGNISEDEEDLIIRLHNLLGNRWSLIAARLPGRTDNEIKNHWNTHLSKRSLTIDDLNKKINLKPDSSNANGLPPRSLAPEYHVTNRVDDCHPSSCLPAELTGSEFDVEQLFDFMSMPSLDPCDVVVSSSSELGMEDFGITDQDSYGDLFGAELCGANEEHGCLDLQVWGSPSQFDELERFMACQDLHPIFHQ